MRTEVTEAVKEAKEKESEATKLARATKTLEAQLIEAKKKADEALMENTVTGDLRVQTPDGDRRKRKLEDSQQLNEIEDMDRVIFQRYEDMVKNTLKQMKDDFEAKLEENRSGIGAIYEKKIIDLATKLANKRKSAVSAVQEMKEMNTQVQGITSRVSELEATNEDLSKRLRELQD